MSAQSALRASVDAMGRAETAGDVALMDRLLHPDLVYRGPDGGLLRKREVLEAMPQRIFERRQADLVGLDEAGATAVATLDVHARGFERRDDPQSLFDGTTRHVMVFEADGPDWRCLSWIITAAAPAVEALHHVSIPVTDLARSRRFYAEVVGLRETERPPFDFEGAWFQTPSGQVHLIVHGDVEPGATFRTGKPIDSRDVHFAVRVPSFRAAVKHLEALGYVEGGADDFTAMRVRPMPTAGFPQIYILDPDRNVVEINAERPD